MTDEEPPRGEVVEILMPMLGMRPYVLIEMREATDGSGDPALFVDSGGGAQEHPLFLPLLVIGESVAEGNPVADMLRAAYVATWNPAARKAIENITREFNADWLPFVRGDSGAAEQIQPTGVADYPRALGEALSDYGLSAPPPASAMPAEAPAPHRARRGSDVEAWIKRKRDAHGHPDQHADGPWEGRAWWNVLDDLLDDYRLHADTGVPLDSDEEMER